MKKLGIWVIAIAAAFIIGVLSANPVVDAAKAGWQPLVADHESRITALEEGQAKQIMRIDGGLSTEIDGLEVFFLDGERTSGNSATDFELASKIVGIDGKITEVQYKIGKKTGLVESVTARIYKNNVLIDSCSLFTHASLHSSCTMTLNESVVKGDLLAMSDQVSEEPRIFVEGKSAFVAITPSS